MSQLVISENQLDVMREAIAGEAPFAQGATPNKVALFTSDSIVTRNSLKADFTLASFAGSTPKSLAASISAQYYYNPLSGEMVIEAPLAVDGLTFICTEDLDPNITVYGYLILDTTLATFIAGARFDDPIVISSAMQGVDIPIIAGRFDKELQLPA
jgi:hypothetical protein